MRARLITIVFMGAVAALTAQAPPSPTQTPPPFRAAANLVSVDMYATEKGQPVEDLKLDEIDVLEDGVPQTVTAFEHVRVRPAAPESQIEPNTVRESRQLAADSRARVFVIFLDTYHTQIEGSAQMRQPLVRFIDRLLGPDDLVAVMTPEMSARDITLGRKTTVISNMMQAEWTWGRRGRVADNDPKESLYEACYPEGGASAGIAAEMKDRRRETLTLDSLDDMVTHLQGLRDERKAIVTITEGWVLAAPDRNLARVIDAQRGAPIPDLLGIGGRRRGDQGAVAGGVSMTECEADRNALAALNNTNRIREISERANRANVTFYPVYARGLAVNDAPIATERLLRPGQDRANLAGRQDSLRQLALETDGLAVIGSNDIDRGMQRILDDTSSYYLLGYYSSNGKLDGRFRNITVRVRRPGVQVRARRGYRAPSVEELTGGPTPRSAPATAITSAFNAVAGVSPRSQFRLRTATWSHLVGGGVAGVVGGVVWAVGELDYALRRDVGWTAGATADVTLVAASGAPVLSKSIDVDARAGLISLRLPESQELPPGEYALRVVLRSKQPGMVPVAETARVIVPPTPGVVGEAVLWHRGLTTGPRFAMTADPRFPRSERVRLELATTTEGMPTARLLDSVGKTLPVPVAVSDRSDPSGEFHWVVAEVALAPLGFGSYAIEVGLGEAKSVTAFTVVP